MSERKDKYEMTGEFLREAGVLVCTFGMLDRFLRDQWPTGEWTAAVLGTGLLLAIFGAIIELRRP